MTRTQRLVKTEALAREQLDRQRQRLAKVQAQLRAEEHKVLSKRYHRVGQLAAEAGLFCLDDSTLAKLFAALRPLCEVPDPGATLAGLLCDAARVPGTAVDGCAHAAHGVAPAVPAG